MSCRHRILSGNSQFSFSNSGSEQCLFFRPSQVWVLVWSFCNWGWGRPWSLRSANTGKQIHHLPIWYRSEYRRRLTVIPTVPRAAQSTESDGLVGLHFAPSRRRSQQHALSADERVCAACPYRERARGEPHYTGGACRIRRSPTQPQPRAFRALGLGGWRGESPLLFFTKGFKHGNASSREFARAPCTRTQVHA